MLICHLEICLNFLNKGKWKRVTLHINRHTNMTTLLLSKVWVITSIVSVRYGQFTPNQMRANNKESQYEGYSGDKNANIQGIILK